MNALGMIELNNIPVGIESADAMLKTADVRLLSAQPVCAGKYIAIVAGDVMAVRSSVQAGIENAADKLVDSLVIPNVHEQVLCAVGAASEIGKVDAVGIIETFSLCAAVVAADTAVKTANIDLIEVRLGRGLGGKSFVVLTGDVAAAQSAVAAAGALEETQGLLSQCVVIPSPHRDLIGSIL
ncbi:MAG: BMC domain-containing protein [Christensenella sp.]|uniref:BMC domain-containing protein n=1 Tax=Christensenella sp. TaxID=1935934 RepID=UPI002B1F04BD|nr:BMC domain-containing protein [Christensenella sp.]MEA5001912.1 BMC domain-containing protein [Christensenella sp.]